MGGERERAIFCWSGGKDSALALHKIREEGRYEIVSLLTTCNERFGRVSMHGVRVALAEQQARAIGLPLDLVFVSEHCTNDEYETKMSEYLARRKRDGVAAAVFGDIFLEDLRAWREKRLASAGMRGVFPLWKRDTRELVAEFVDLGFQSVVCCVNDAFLGPWALGRTIDRHFVASLPRGVDPCGENGEFHSFAFSGPIFSETVRFVVGEKVYRPVEGTPRATGFWFCDLLEKS